MHDKLVKLTQDKIRRYRPNNNLIYHNSYIKIHYHIILSSYILQLSSWYFIHYLKFLSLRIATRKRLQFMKMHLVNFN